MFVPVCACEEKLLGPQKVWSAFVGPGVRICAGDRIVEKNFWGPGKFCRLSWDQGFEYVTGTGSQKKTFRAPESFFPIATKSGMTASAYLVNFRINLGDLAEVALIWPEIVSLFLHVLKTSLLFI